MGRDPPSGGGDAVGQVEGVILAAGLSAGRAPPPHTQPGSLCPVPPPPPSPPPWTEESPYPYPLRISLGQRRQRTYQIQHVNDQAGAEEALTLIRSSPPLEVRSDGQVASPGQIVCGTPGVRPAPVSRGRDIAAVEDHCWEGPSRTLRLGVTLSTVGLLPSVPVVCALYSRWRSTVGDRGPAYQGSDHNANTPDPYHRAWRHVEIERAGHHG